MYGFLWRHLPGPWPIKILECLILAGLAFYGLMEYVYPWADQVWNLSGQATV